MVPFTNGETAPLWAKNEHWLRGHSNILGAMKNKYPQSKGFQFIKRASLFLPCIVNGTPISISAKFSINGNKSGTAGYKSRKISEMFQNPYDSIKDQNCMPFLWYF